MFDYVEEKLESLVKIIFWILSIVFVISFFAYALMISSTLKSLYYWSDSAGIYIFLYVVFGLIVTAACIAVYYVITLMILSYLNLVRFSRSTARTLEEIQERLDGTATVSPLTKAAAATTAASRMNAGDWKCPKCGKVNSRLVGTCGCGQSKY